VGPPIIPSPVIPGATQFVLVGSQDGSAYAIDATTGAELWSEPLGDIVQAAPAGIFSAFGSIHDFVLVGTRDFPGTGVFHMLNADDGSVADSFDNQPPGMGIVSGMATIDYRNERVYFASRDGGDGRTLWCLDIGPGTLTERWGIPLGDIDGSPVVRGDRVYVGNVAGEVYAVDADTGGILWTPPFSTGDGQPKDFIFPDRWSDDLYFSTSNQVWGLSDVGPNAVANFPAVNLPAGARPSILLHAPGTTWLYVGGSDGRLYQIDVSGPTLDQVTLGDGTAVIGAPTLDRGVIPNMVYVGGVEGVVYGVEVPLP
jgi:outer membrane protein assembly factor BamB